MKEFPLGGERSLRSRGNILGKRFRVERAAFEFVQSEATKKGRETNRE